MCLSFHFISCVLLNQEEIFSPPLYYFQTGFRKWRRAFLRKSCSLIFIDKHRRFSSPAADRPTNRTAVVHFVFSSSSHTPTKTSSRGSPPHLIAFPFFLAERFMVWRMLETGYYHVRFELISQTKWSTRLRLHLRAFTAPRSGPSPPPELRRQLPRCLVFHQTAARSQHATRPPLPPSWGWMKGSVCSAEGWCLYHKSESLWWSCMGLGDKREDIYFGGPDVETFLHFINNPDGAGALC